jgi:membrane associated rhomboid family serine protease
MPNRGRTRGVGVLSFPGFPKGVKWLLIANVAVFFLGFFAQLAGLDRPFSYLALIPAAVVKLLFVWQLVTYLFLHAGIFHILWNMLALWMFGAELEQVWGTRRFLRFYFFCGVGAGVCVVLLNYLLPAGPGHSLLPKGDPYSATLGSSGAIFGLLLAYAMLFPTRTILFSFLVPMQVKWYVIIFGVLSLMGAYQVNSGVSAFAHLGGLLFGYIYMKLPGGSFDVAGPVRRRYRQWKLQRAKKKFQVYLRKQGNQDPWVH